MSLGDKLSAMRKKNNYTQEQLAELLGVSRQAVSKWESGAAFPETEKLLRLSSLFGCSLDYLLREDGDIHDPEEARSGDGALPLRFTLRERKSTRTLWGRPLWHVGRRARGIVAVGLDARGLIAVGLRARGLVSLGLLSIGVFSSGLLSLGVLSLGLAALGCVSAGCFAAGILAAGAVSLGVISLGAVAVGDFSAGALALGRYFALGDDARAMIALGDSRAAGSLFRKLGSLTAGERETVLRLLDEAVPAYLAWAKGFVRLLL